MSGNQPVKLDSSPLGPGHPLPTPPLLLHYRNKSKPAFRVSFSSTYLHLRLISLSGGICQQPPS